jgi:hypothetical protein
VSVRFSSPIEKGQRNADPNLQTDIPQIKASRHSLDQPLPYCLMQALVDILEVRFFEW